MNLPQYVTIEEVQRVCHALDLRDWTRLTEPSVLPGEAARILAEINVHKMAIEPEDFRAGLEVELEHGLRFDDANVTNNHPLLTGKIVLAHLKETLDYYHRIAVAETEADLFKAICTEDMPRVIAKYRKLIEAKTLLQRTETDKMT